MIPTLLEARFTANYYDVTSKTLYISNDNPSDLATARILAAARSRLGSDSPPGCHSLPSRRFATSIYTMEAFS